MKSTGIVRKVDNLGRIVLPIELRRTLNIDLKDSIEIFTEGEYILLKKYEPVCVLCGEGRDTIKFMGKRICDRCKKDIKNIIWPVITYNRKIFSKMMLNTEFEKKTQKYNLNIDFCVF